MQINPYATLQEKREIATEIIHYIYQNCPDLCRIVEGNENWITFELRNPLACIDQHFIITETNNLISQVTEKSGFSFYPCDLDNLEKPQFWNFKRALEFLSREV